MQGFIILCSQPPPPRGSGGNIGVGLVLEMKKKLFVCYLRGNGMPSYSEELRRWEGG